MIPYRPEGRGSPLFTTLVFLLLLLALGLGGLYWVGSRSRPRTMRAAARNQVARLARRGIERGQRLLAHAPDWNELLRGRRCDAPLVSGKGRVLCTGKKMLLDQRVGPRGRAAYSVFLRNDDDEAVHTGQRDEDGRVILICEARGPGRSNQMTIEVVLSQRSRRFEGPSDYPQVGADAAGSNVLWLP